MKLRIIWAELNSTSQLNHKLQIIALVIAVMIGSAITEAIVAIAQESQLNGNISRNNTTALDLDSDGKNIVVTWLELNNTNTNSAPMIRISNEDFWKIFGPLFELSTNTTRE